MFTIICVFLFYLVGVVLSGACIFAYGYKEVKYTTDKRERSKAALKIVDSIILLSIFSWLTIIALVLVVIFYAMMGEFNQD